MDVLSAHYVLSCSPRFEGLKFGTILMERFAFNKDNKSVDVIAFIIVIVIDSQDGMQSQIVASSM